jgi:hypothetical protein
MHEQTYCQDRIETWHATRHASEFDKRVIAKCGHMFTPSSRQVTNRPSSDKFCLGCLGAERLEAIRSKCVVSGANEDSQKNEPAVPPRDFHMPEIHRTRVAV